MPAQTNSSKRPPALYNLLSPDSAACSFGNYPTERWEAALIHINSARDSVPYDEFARIAPFTPLDSPRSNPRWPSHASVLRSADACLHSNQARGQVCEPHHQLAARQLDLEHYRASFVEADRWEAYTPISIPMTAIAGVALAVAGSFAPVDPALRGIWGHRLSILLA
jgi:hypothetical protein